MIYVIIIHPCHIIRPPSRLPPAMSLVLSHTEYYYTTYDVDNTRGLRRFLLGTLRVIISSLDNVFSRDLRNNLSIGQKCFILWIWKTVYDGETLKFVIKMCVYASARANTGKSHTSCDAEHDENFKTLITLMYILKIIIILAKKKAG